MTSGAQKWLPLAARRKRELQDFIDRGLARGESPLTLRRKAAASLSSTPLPRLLEQAIMDSLSFNHKPRGLKR